MPAAILPATAGTTTQFGKDTARSCLTLEDEKAPRTPPAVRRWRKSNFCEPGLRVIHPGLQEDFRDKEHNIRFGKIKIESDHVEDVWQQPGTESEYARVKEAHKNAVYASERREPLGKSSSRVLPGGDAFGKKTTTTDDGAKKLIYARTNIDARKVQYVKSHGSFDPGEQLTRNYDWKGCDLRVHRFGTGNGSHLAFNGAAPGAVAALRRPSDGDPTLSSTRVQNFKDLHDKLGRARNLGTPAPRDRVFGKPSIREDGDWDARTCVQGDYPPAQQAPDLDLGKTLTPGFRNTTTGTRALGIPTVRSDIPKYGRRSLADSKNYGDDPSAQDLLYPSVMTSMGLKDADLADAMANKKVPHDAS
ncbi:hypothetical protein CTAYLR_002921 [Chrysophaeum taylorii]|uniref:Flagellar associated protein n=1 Tax=Chrysophaeum taylorii TaxID=2483200 RepID=A0AAD7UM67_9STRA|nr:hypothetical protein CTAYLR_002921 [Chrysophaeum taylorii]